MSNDFETSETGTADKVDRLEDALDHIMRVARQAGTITKRLKMIELRAKSALENTDEWRDYDYPRNRQAQNENLRGRLRDSLDRGKLLADELALIGGSGCHHCSASALDVLDKAGLKTPGEGL